MISWLGRSLVMAALLFAASGSVLGFHAGATKSRAGLLYARWAALLFGGTMIGANLLMVYALLKRDFSVSYVSEVGSNDIPDRIAVISLWASLHGSILFWGGVLGVYTIMLAVTQRNKHPEYMPYTFGVLGLVCVFFSLLVASIANPFAPSTPEEMAGFHMGPNALLQNHPLMAFHPPMLYLGYVGMAVPFSMVSAALLAGRLEAGWAAPIRRFMLIPWTFLTVGIVMGGWWSYEVLGWGGYWAWDPVEDASFMPWLTGTAFLHSAMVMERRGQLKVWTPILGMSTFMLTLLGTFMTRSGVFNSVHSFTQSEIGPVFLAAIAVTFTGSFLLLAFRSHTLVQDNDGTGKVEVLLPWMGRTTAGISRETTILLQNLLFTTFAFMVLLGVLYPLINEEMSGTQVTVGQPYFDRMALPLGLALVALMGVGPAIPWGAMSPAAAGKRLAAPLIAGVTAAGAALIGGIHHPYVLLALGLCAFATVANVGEYVDPVRMRMAAKKESAGAAMVEVLKRGRRRFGGHVAHLGAVMAVVAIAMSSAYKMERDYVLHLGESANVGAWSATWTGSHQEEEPRLTATVATFTLTKNGADAGVLEPKLNYYRTMREPIGTPAVHTTAAGDVYMSLLQVDKEKGIASVRIMTMPLVAWLWLSPALVALGTIIALWPQRAKVTAAAPAAVPGAEPA